MDSLFKVNDVIQFNEKHKWCGCFGIIEEIKTCEDDYRYLIGVPIPEKGTAYIFSMESSAEVDFIGIAELAPSSKKEEEEKDD